MEILGQHLKETHKIKVFRLVKFMALILLLAPTLNSRPASAQTFSSTSNGSDGALVLTTPGTIIFDPTTFSPPLDVDGDGVYHFTTITIAAGVTVRFGADVLGLTPITWLATGDVVIEGTLDLNGGNGNNAVNSSHSPAIAGAGGHEGGLGASNIAAATPGGGFGGGVNAPSSGCDGAGGGGGHATAGGNTNCGVGFGGKAYGNNFILPLLGGSGGGGGTLRDGGISPGGSGGAGGGAILIVSSTQITVNGEISSVGGRGGLGKINDNGGGGSGGSIRLMATNIGGTGVLSTVGGLGQHSGGNGSNGRIRIEAFQHAFTGSTGNIGQFVTPGPIFPSTNLPTVRVVSVAGTTIPNKPLGLFAPADITINAGGAVTLQIQGSNVPLGTVVNLMMRSETGGVVEFNSTPLAGTLAASTATATVTVPSGFSRFTVEASFTPAP